MKLGPKRIVRHQNSCMPLHGCLATSTRFFENKNGEEKSRWRINNIHYCRDEFHRSFTRKSQNLVLCHPDKEMEDLATFIWKVEDILKIKEYTRIGKTQRNHFTWIKVSPFWLESSMRRSFFTALLRSARTYSIAQDNFQATLYSLFYFNQTRHAVERFLAGYTRYVGRRYGWHNVFCDKTSEQVKHMLVRP